MYLIELLVPIHDNAGVPFLHGEFEQVRHELT